MTLKILKEENYGKLSSFQTPQEKETIATTCNNTGIHDSCRSVWIILNLFTVQCRTAMNCLHIAAHLAASHRAASAKSNKFQLLAPKLSAMENGRGMNGEHRSWVSWTVAVSEGAVLLLQWKNAVEDPRGAKWPPCRSCSFRDLQSGNCHCFNLYCFEGCRNRHQTEVTAKMK